jgi:hypothetical protein
MSAGVWFLQNSVMRKYLANHRLESTLALQFPGDLIDCPTTTSQRIETSTRVSPKEQNRVLEFEKMREGKFILIGFASF